MSFTGRVKSIFNSDDSPDGSEDPNESEDPDTPDEPAEEECGVTVGDYTWDDYIEEYATNSAKIGDDESEYLYENISEKDKHGDIGPHEIRDVLHEGGSKASELDEVVEKNTVNVQHENEDEFFRTSNGVPTIISRYDVEKAVAAEKKKHFVEMERYWVNKPFAAVILFRSTRENEIKYFVIEPYMNLEEDRILDFLSNKLEDTIKFSEEATKGERTDAERGAHIEKKVYELLFRYGLIENTPFEDVDDSRPTTASSTNTRDDDSSGEKLSEKLDVDDEVEPVDEEDESDDSGSLFSRGSKNKQTIVDKLIESEEPDIDDKGDVPTEIFLPPEALPEIDGLSVRPEKAVMNDGSTKLTDYQVMKMIYYLKRDAVSFGKIDPIKHDINVEDISCNGYYKRVWAYHGEHEQIISNVKHGKKTLDDFIVNLAQRSGKGISKREPQVDVTLPDGSRGQLTLGAEVSDHGTNYTIRQFKDVPFTPLDLIAWKTFSPEQMAFLWLCIENHKSLIFAGGTASGKTTSLNAISLFIPSNTKIVSIEDTREVELPQENWVASVTRASFSADGIGGVDEFALLEAALRQRPDYIVMGEIRGEEGRTLFQVMSTGHTTYTTFHADSVGEVIKRFTTDPINVSKTLFTALDLVSIQIATRVDGNKVRRNKTLTEINEYNSETDEINVNDVYQWNAETDEFIQTEDSEVMNSIQFDRGWTEQELNDAISKREVVLAYMMKEGLNTYAEVAATFQAFINGPEMVLNLIANGLLEESLDNLREMESVGINIDPEKEEMVPRPEPPEEIIEWCDMVLERELFGVLEGREGVEPDGKLSDLLKGALSDHDVEINEPDETDSKTTITKQDIVDSNNEVEWEDNGENQKALVRADADDEDENSAIQYLSGFLEEDETLDVEDEPDIVSPEDDDSDSTSADGFTLDDEDSETGSVDELSLDNEDSESAETSLVKFDDKDKDENGEPAEEPVSDDNDNTEQEDFAGFVNADPQEPDDVSGGQDDGN